MGRLRCRVLPILPPSPFELQRTSRDDAARLLRMRMRASMGGFPVNNRESAGALPPGRPAPWQRALLQMKRAAPRRPVWWLSSAARWRETCRSHANARRFRAPGTIPTVDFLLHHLGAVVKKTSVKSLVGPTTDPTGSAASPKNQTAAPGRRRCGSVDFWLPPVSASTAASWRRRARAAFPSRPPGSSPPFAPSRRPAPRSGARVRARPRTRRPGPRA